jgi:membrane associated rhomboid family serine protease
MQPGGLTLLIIIVTVILSILAFSNRELFLKAQFNAYQVYHRKEIFRLISHGFIHANWWHLGINMFVLFSFGTQVEHILFSLEKAGILGSARLAYLLLYLLAIVFSSTISLVKHKDDIWYNAVGASGAVSAVVFFTVFFDPWDPLQLYFFIPVPRIIFAVLYLLYSQYMSRRGGDNIGHDAHFLGGIFGFLFPLFIQLDLYKYFIAKLFFLQ